MEYSSPITVVHHAMHIYTERKPADNDAVLALMADALAEMGPDGVDAASRITRSLDSFNAVPLGHAGADALQQVAVLALEPESSRAVHWGALSLLGALSLAYTTAPEADGYNSVSAQAVAATAHELLWGIRHHTDDQATQEFADHLLNHAPNAADDIAVELLDLPDHVERLVVQEIVDEIETGLPIDEELIGNDRIFGDPSVHTVESLQLNQTIVSKMDWLKITGDMQVTVQPIWAGNAIVAYAVDLMPYNPITKKESVALEEHVGIAATTWQRLGSTIVRFAQTGVAPRFVGETVKVPMLASKNTGSDHNLTRSYFTPLGRHQEKPLVGVVAMARGKSGQSKIVKVFASSKAASNKKSL